MVDLELLQTVENLQHMEMRNRDGTTVERLTLRGSFGCGGDNSERT